MKKATNTFKKGRKHAGRKAKAKNEVVSHRSKKHVPRNHPYPEAKLSPDR